VQTVASPQIDGAPGGVAQVREVAAALIRASKERDMSTLLVGHVTKDGSIAGPRLLEHLVDVVLHFEGDRHNRLRMVRGVKNRYGATDESLLTAWQRLLSTVYDARDVRIFPEHFGGVLTAKPSYSGITAGLGSWLENVRQDVDGLLWYDPALLVDGWARMIDAAESDAVLARGTLGHDLVDVGIAVMSRVADHLYLDVVEHLSGTGGDVQRRVDRFLRVFDDLERLLGTKAEFTFQHWEDAAARWATNELERTVLIDNARRIVTTWGESSSPLLDDYAGRVWSGLAGGYYRRRWALWAGGLEAAVAAGPAAGTLASELDVALRELTESFIRHGPGPLSSSGVQDTTEESRRLHTTYATLARSLPRASQRENRGAR
jgi:alpha-N-acetylglucosaminidase